MEEYPTLCETPEKLVGLAKDAGITITSVRNVTDGYVEISLEANKPALFVTLTSSLQGNFDKNSFALSPYSVKVQS
jgi:hypothetical protein